MRVSAAEVKRKIFAARRLEQSEAAACDPFRRPWRLGGEEFKQPIPELSDEFDGTALDEQKWLPRRPYWSGRELTDHAPFWKLAQALCETRRPRRPRRRADRRK